MISQTDVRWNKWRFVVAAVATCAAGACGDSTAPNDAAAQDAAMPDGKDAGDAHVAKDCLDEPGVICTWAGTGELGFNGDGKPIEESNMYWPIDLSFSEIGTFVLDWNNHRVRQVLDDGTFKTVIGTDFVGDGPEDMSDLVPPGAPGTEVLLNHPTQVVPMPDGTLTLVAWHNHKLRRYDPETGLVTVLCGRGAGFAGDGGPFAKALLNQPNNMVLADDGSQYILDQRNQVVRVIDPEGIIHTFAGTPGEAGFGGDGGKATKAKLNFPAGSNPPPGGGLALDDDGNLYISDTLNHRIRRVDPDGKITTLAGTGKAGFSGDDGPATEAQLDSPYKLKIGPDGRLYIGDQNNHRIRAIDLDDGTITTVAGNGDKGFSGDGGPPTEAALQRPAGVSFDEDGAMYILDMYNSRIRRVLPEEK